MMQVMACPLAYTTDGFEMQLGSNHLGKTALAMSWVYLSGLSL